MQKNFLEDGSKLEHLFFLEVEQLYLKNKVKFYYLKLAQALEDFGVVEEMPKLDGKKMIMIIAPKK